MRLLFSLPLFLVAACGRDDSRIPPSRDMSAEIADRVASVRAWMPRCSNGMLTKELQSNDDGDVNPTVKGSCDDGDFLLFGGLACLSGETDQCSFIGKSQSNSGRMWRSPLRVDKEAINSFSRDMAVGFLAYVAKTKDAASLTKWVDYVRDQDGKMCLTASDNRCDISAGIRTLAKLVGRSVGAEVNWGNLSTISRDSYDAQIYGQARFAPPGFPLHLVASQILILEHLSLSGTSIIDQTREVLHNRQPLNALFAHVSRRDDTATQLMLNQAPTSRPARLRQWSFERADSELAYLQSMGWEFITVNNLIKP